MRNKLLIFYTILISVVANAQHENTMYFMDRVTYASTLNAAQTPACKWYLGGLAIPLSGQLPPSLYMGATTPFAYDRLISDKKDSDGNFHHIISDPSLFNDFKDKLQDQGILSLEVDAPILMFGFRAKNSFWSFSWTEKLRYNSAFPKDLFLLPIEGNGVITDANLDGLGINATAYREYALGYKQKVNKYFEAGFRFKFLSGYYNVYTEHSEFSLTTNDENASLDAKMNMIINTSFPIDSVSHDENGNVDGVHTRTPSQEELTKMATFSENWGVALDFGIKKEFNSEITLYASVVDLGYMTWVKDPYSFIFDGEQHIYGVKVDTIDFENFDTEEYLDDMLGDVEYRSVGGEYTEWLPLKLYGGADYKIRKWMTVGGLYRGERLNNKMRHSFTGSLNFRYMKFSSTSLSYTVRDGNYHNIGFGTSFRMGPFNTFVVTDNITVPFLWYKNQMFSIRMGTTYVFGVKPQKKARKSVPLLDIY